MEQGVEHDSEGKEGSRTWRLRGTAAALKLGTAMEAKSASKVCDAARGSRFREMSPNRHIRQPQCSDRGSFLKALQLLLEVLVIGLLGQILLT